MKNKLNLVLIIFFIFCTLIVVLIIKDSLQINKEMADFEAKITQKSASFKKTSAKNAFSNQVNIPSGWLVYTNSQYKFSFAYPPDFSVSKSTENRGTTMYLEGYIINGDKNSQPQVWIYKTGCDQACFEKDMVDWWPKNKIDQEKIIINGQDAYLIHSNESGPINTVLKSYFIRSPQDTVVTFEFPGLKSRQDSITQDQQQILSSFSFF